MTSQAENRIIAVASKIAAAAPGRQPELSRTVLVKWDLITALREALDEAGLSPENEAES